jgi:PncC family amidohydrolase
MDSLASLGAAVAGLLRERNQTVAVAESSAGGLINAILVAVPGASTYYLGGAVIYTAASRAGLLGITPAEMKDMRSASEPFAQLMARRMREKTRATWGLAETGATGPLGNRYGDAPGHACLAVSGRKRHDNRNRKRRPRGQYARVRAQGAGAARVLRAQRRALECASDNKRTSSMRHTNLHLRNRRAAQKRANKAAKLVKAAKRAARAAKKGKKA